MRANVVTNPVQDEPCAVLHDSRFRRLVGSEAWGELRPAIRARFGKRLEGSTVAIYRGEIIAARMNFAGRLLAQLCRTIGAPLPLWCETGVPAVVIVSEDIATAGQRWTRVYHRHHGAPQAIVSAKAFAGPTGLEEHIGRGFGMALRVMASPDCLIFASEHYFWQLGSLRLRLPRWLTPGQTTVTHRDIGGGEFSFELNLHHPWLGELIHQTALFCDG